MTKATGCPRLRRSSNYLPMALLFPALCSSGTELRRKDCQHPDLPDHTTYRCMSTSCQLSLRGSVFRAGSRVHYYCEAGYIQASQPAVSVCRGGQWRVLTPAICKPLAGPLVPHSGTIIAISSFPVVAATVVTLSALLLVAMVCVLVRPKPCRHQCWRWYERMEEPEASTVAGGLVPLPSYEEAICGSQGGARPTGPPASTSLIFSGVPSPAAEAVESCGDPEVVTPPPSYQESQAAAADSSGPAWFTAPPAQFLFPEGGTEPCRSLGGPGRPQHYSRGMQPAPGLERAPDRSAPLMGPKELLQPPLNCRVQPLPGVGPWG